MLKKWDPDTTLRFVNLYAGHTCLWDKRTTGYKIRNAREAAVRDIIEKMGIAGLSADDVKCKIRIIRNTYINEKKKMRNMKRMIYGKKVNYVCTLPWFRIADQFLSKVVKKKISTEAVPIYMEEGGGSEQIKPQLAFASTNDEDSQQSSANSTSQSEDCLETIVKMESREESGDDATIAHVLPFNRHDEENRFSNNAAENNDSNCLISPMACYIEEDDMKTTTGELNEFDVFAKNIALQLKQLPLENALEVQNKIHDLIVSERLKVIRGRKQEND